MNYEDHSFPVEINRLIDGKERMPVPVLFAEFMQFFDDFSLQKLAEIISFLTLESSTNDSLEAQLYTFLEEKFKNDERFRFVSTEVDGVPLEFIEIKALTQTATFTVPINPFIRKDPSSSYIGFHDTTNYWGQVMAKDGVKDPNETNREFYVHPQYLWGDEYWNDYFLERLLYYGNLRNVPNRDIADDYRRKDDYPPLEVRQSDFRCARIAVILPHESYKSRDNDEKATDFSDISKINYELRVNTDIPRECISVTNVYHSFMARRERISNGFLESSDFNDPKYAAGIASLRARYAEYDINEETGLKNT